MKAKHIILKNINQNDYRIIHHETNEELGRIQTIEDPHNKNRVSLKIDSNSSQNILYLKEALPLLINHLLNKGTHRIETEVINTDTTMQQLLQQLNFKYEGMRQDAIYNEEIYYNAHLFGYVKKSPSINLEDYLNFVTSHTTQSQFIQSAVSYLPLFNHPNLSHSRLYFLITFSSLLSRLQTDSVFMSQTINHLLSLNWSIDEIKEVLFALDRHLTTPITEEEKIVHDIYLFKEMDAENIAKALSTTKENHPLLDKINHNNFIFLTPTGKEIGEERLNSTKKFIHEL